jgi:hypothetical protein
MAVSAKDAVTVATKLNVGFTSHPFYDEEETGRRR